MRQLVRWLVVDSIVVAAIIIGASLELDTISSWAQQQFQLSPNFSTAFVVAGAALVSAPFWIGMVRVSRVLGFELASRVFPDVSLDKLDMAAAPRKLLVVTLQLAIVLLVGIPLVAITQPFVPTLRGAAVLVFLLTLLAFAFWRNATSLQGHTRAAAQAMVQAIGRQTRTGRAMEADQRQTQAKLDDVNRIITGLGSPVSIELRPGSSAVGRTLAEVKVRGLTGATILAIEPRANRCLCLRAASGCGRATCSRSRGPTWRSRRPASCWPPKTSITFPTGEAPRCAGWTEPRSTGSCRFGTAAPLSMGSRSIYGVWQSHVAASPRVHVHVRLHSPPPIPHPPPRRSRRSVRGNRRSRPRCSWPRACGSATCRSTAIRSIGRRRGRRSRAAA